MIIQYAPKSEAKQKGRKQSNRKALLSKKEGLFKKAWQELCEQLRVSLFSVMLSRSYALNKAAQDESDATIIDELSSFLSQAIDSNRQRSSPFLNQHSIPTAILSGMQSIKYE